MALIAFAVVRTPSGRKRWHRDQVPSDRFRHRCLSIAPTVGLGPCDLAERKQPVAEREQSGNIVGDHRRHEPKARREHADHVRDVGRHDLG